MRKWFELLMTFWNKIEHWFTLVVGIILVSSSVVLAQLAKNSMETYVLLCFCLALILGGMMSFYSTIVLKLLKTNKSLVENYRKIYDSSKKKVIDLNENLLEVIKLCNKWKDHANEWKLYANSLQQRYFSDTDIVLASLNKHSEIFPQQQAMFSNLVKNAVHASTIKSLLDFSDKVDKHTTVFLIRLNHKDFAWHVEITGREIELEQATYVVKCLEKKLKDFAGKNSLVKNTPKICN